MDSYYPSQRDRRFQDLPIDIATIMNTGDVDALCASLQFQPRHVADTALFRAAQFNQAFFIEPLVTSCSAQVDAVDPRTNCTVLHVACGERAVETVQALLAAGAAADKKNKAGHSALMVAVQQLVWQNLPGRAEATITTMLNTAGYVHSRGIWNEETPMTFAADLGNATIVNQLLAAGALVNSPAKVQVYKQYPDAAPIGFLSPLHAAAKKGDAAMVSLLLAAGAEPNGRDGKGRTPLHYAAKHENACYQLLVTAGASKDAYDSDYKFPR
jgi:ankyrin repeat protein